MKKIAVIATEYRPFAHADVIVTRWITPYPTDCEVGWAPMRSEIASVYTEQIPGNDLSRKICGQAGIPVFDTIRDALTLGGDTLAVDAVLLIGEHGDYPHNRYQQKLYPRKRFFDAIVEVFRETGRSVPIFNDKHLSWSFEESAAMIRTADELGFPLYGGSSLPHCPILPEPAVRDGEKVRETLSLYYGHPEHYGYHAIEFALALLEARKGGETGIRAVRSITGRASREVLVEAGIPPELLHQAFVAIGYPDLESTVPFVLDRSEQFTLYQFEHTDGSRVHHLLVERTVNNWIVAAQLDTGEVRTCRSGAGGATVFFNHFAQFSAKIEDFFVSGEAPASVLRTHMAAGALERALHALFDTPGEWIATPELAFSYPAMPPRPAPSR